MKEEKNEYEKSLTYKVLRQDLEFERTGENRMTRLFMTRTRADRVLRLLKKDLLILTVVKDRKALWKGYVNKEGFRVMTDSLALTYKLDITYSDLREVKIILEELCGSRKENRISNQV